MGLTGCRPPGRPLVLFVGNVRSGEYESLRSKGHRVGLLRDVHSSSWSAADADLDLVLPWDKRSGSGGIAEHVRRLEGGAEVTAVLVTREAYVEEWAQAMKLLGRPAPDPAWVGAVRSKALMRARFERCLGPATTGRCAVAERAQDVIAFGQARGWPVVLKPAALYSSLFVRTIAAPTEAASTFEAVRDGVLHHVASKGLPRRFERLLVEEFIAGTNHSIDLVVDRDGQPTPTPVVDVITGWDLGGSDFCHVGRLAPSRASEADLGRMTDLAVAACRALELQACAAHVEFILTPSGPRLLEVGVRPGGHRARMLAQGYGVDFPSAYLAAMTGGQPNLERRKEQPFAIVTPFAPSSGAFAGIHDLNRVVSLPSYRRHNVYARIGDPAGTAADGHWQTLAIELMASSVEALECDIKQIWDMADLVITERPQN
jgi:biotin carboxylase